LAKYTCFQQKKSTTFIADWLVAPEKYAHSKPTIPIIPGFFAKDQIVEDTRSFAGSGWQDPLPPQAPGTSPL